MCAKLHYLKYLDYCHAKKTPYDLSIIGRLVFIQLTVSSWGRAGRRGLMRCR